MDTTITGTADGGTPATSKRGARLRIWAKYAAGSVAATVLSQAAFTVAYGVCDLSAAVASVAAFFVGAVPNYLLNRAWAWKGRDVRSKRGAVLAYIAVIGVSNLLAIGMTSLADGLVRSHVSAHGMRTLLVDAAYLGSYGVMFVAKFLLFDGVVFDSDRRSRRQVRHTTRA